MENTKTTELRHRKSSVKARLISTLVMLLVSAIMLSSTTYAWFVLSTAPEVKGMSTTVGANGSLEIALLNDSTDTAVITSNVGDSSVVRDVIEANITWGNLVDLSSPTYGLNNSKLYPAALNFAAGGNTSLFDLSSMLKYPVYGTDGRVAELSPATGAGKFNDGAFGVYENSYGVRVVGSTSNADPVAYAFRLAKNNYASFMNSAKNEASTSLNTRGDALIQIVIDHGTNDEATFTADVVQTIRDALGDVQKSADNIKKALQNAYEAHRLVAGEAASPDVYLLDLSGFTAMQAQVDAYNALNDQTQQALGSIPDTGTGANGAYVWADIRTAMQALVNSDGMTLDGKTIDELKPTLEAIQNKTATEEQKAWVNSMIFSSEPSSVVVKGGLYGQVADFVDNYKTSEPLDAVVNVPEFGEATLDMNLEVQKTVDPAYRVQMETALNALVLENSGSAVPIINTTYGYVVDLAFRCNAATNLTLSGATERVNGQELTQGNGSTFKVTQAAVELADVQKLAKALRVVFVLNEENNYQILGVAGMEVPTALTADNKYELHMYNYEVDPATGGIMLEKKAEDGSIVSLKAENDNITALEADVAKCISALVYLDGNYVDYAMNGVEGALNLQFGSTTVLTPMDYSGYVTGEETPGTPVEPEVPGGEEVVNP